MSPTSENPPKAESSEERSQETQDKQSTKDKLLADIKTRLAAAEEAQSAAEEAHKRAETSEDPDVKALALEEARKLEEKAKSEMKIVRRLESGVWQGGESLFRFFIVILLGAMMAWKGGVFEEGRRGTGREGFFCLA